MSSRAGEQTLGGGCPEKCSANRDPDAPRTRSDASRHAVTRRAAESCASQAPTEDPTGIGVIAPEPRADKARAARDGSPPDRFLRTPGFGGSTWRTADAAQAEAPEALCDGRLGDGLDNGFDFLAHVGVGDAKDSDIGHHSSSGEVNSKALHGVVWYAGYDVV